jgi:hypothetical protein
MTTLFKRSAVAAFFAVCASGAWAASPCDGVDRSLTMMLQAAWAPEIAKQLGMKSVYVLQAFRFKGWSIIYVDTRQTDQVYLFYANDPLTSHYVTLWGGDAAMDEEDDTRAWTLKNAPGIPPKLASCFAWHVTKDR